ncbi:MAG: cobalt-precorrin-6A reductase [Pseudomonadota bacterium]
MQLYSLDHPNQWIILMPSFSGLPNILILGGTADARILANRLAATGRFDVTLSLAGRTEHPAQPDDAVQLRRGGFGGATGLADWVRTHNIDLLIDATHPFAANITAHAAQAIQQTGIPGFAIRRPVWERQDGDCWQAAQNVAEATSLLGDVPRRVFLAIGRQEIAAFAKASHHHYVIRSVDPIPLPPPLQNAICITARGPFDVVQETDLLHTHRIEVIVCKNSGGTATYGKIAAARALGIDVIMIERPQTSGLATASTIEDALHRINDFLG